MTHVNAPRHAAGGHAPERPVTEHGKRRSLRLERDLNEHGKRRSLRMERPVTEHGKRRSLRMERAVAVPGNRRSLRIRAILSLGVLLGGGGVLTMAAWTDDATATTTFTTGSVVLKLNGVDTITIPAWTGIRPGSTYAALIPVNNAGTLPVGYTMTGAGTSALAAAGGITAQAFSGTNVMAVNPQPTAQQPTPAASTCSAGTPITTAAVTLTAPIIPVARALAAAPASENICVLFTLPSAAPVSLQSLSATLTLTFTATNS